MTELSEASRQLLWSLWSELGIPGGGRAHQRVALDPEPLIAFTPHLARHDHRLLGLAFDWCVHHADQVSKSRLLGLSRLLPPLALASFAGLNGALARHGVSWRPRGEPLELEARRSRMALPIERPALLAFRIRAMAGASVRADVLTRLLLVPQSDANVATLTPPGTSRRGVERVLADLVAAELVLVHGSPRKRRFCLRDRASFAQLTGAEGLVWWEWQRVLALLGLFHELAEQSGLSPRLRQVHANAARPEIAQMAAELGLAPLPRLRGRQDAFEALAAWCTRVAVDLATGAGPDARVPDLRRSG